MRTDRRTDMTNINVVFRNFARTPKTDTTIITWNTRIFCRLLDSCKAVGAETFTQWEEIHRAKPYATDLTIYCKRYKFCVICNHLHHTRNKFKRMKCIIPELLLCPTEISTIPSYLPYSPPAYLSQHSLPPLWSTDAAREGICLAGEPISPPSRISGDRNLSCKVWEVWHHAIGSARPMYMPGNTASR